MVQKKESNRKPATKSDLLAVKTELQKAIGSVGTALNGKIDSFRTELKGEISSVKTGLNDKIDSVGTALNGKIDSFRTELKGEISSVKTGLNDKIDSVRTSLDSKIDSVRTELKKDIGVVDTKVNKLALEIITIKNDLSEVKQNMMTRDDKNEITNLIDGVMGEIKSFRDSIVIRGHWLEVHDGKLNDHDKRIKKLEEAISSS